MLNIEFMLFGNILILTTINLSDILKNIFLILKVIFNILNSGRHKYVNCLYYII